LKAASWCGGAKKGERLKTLDGVERVLDAEDLVVADHAKALGLAGVMGGWDSMITPATKNVLVEAAWFDPIAVRRTARRHGLHTDASHRFERGADFNAASVASALVSAISAGEWRLAGRRTGGRAGSGHRGADGQTEAGGTVAERGAGGFWARRWTRRALLRRRSRWC
jgi:hypothetical protein